MQYALDFGTPTPLVIVDDRLKAHYGLDWSVTVRSDPVDHLVLAMVGNRTHDEISLEAFKNLRTTFRPWERLAEAPSSIVNTCIEKITYADKYANFIPQALHIIILKRGTLSLDFLADWSPAQAQAWLEELPGVGPKIRPYWPAAGFIDTELRCSA